MSASITIGTQLIAVSGYLSLEKGITYYFLKSGKDGCVYMVDFIMRPPKKIKKKYGDKKRTVSVTPTPIPHLVVMQRLDFENGMLGGHITKLEKQASLPPWLEDLEGKNLVQIDLKRSNPKRSHQERIDRQIEVIYPLIRDADSVICSDDPDLRINQFARTCSPKQNETRTRLAFYVYILFGRNRNALHFPSHKIGRWARNNMLARVKQGRPSYKGKGYGNNASPELIDKAIDCYQRERGPGVTMDTIYQAFMKRDLGCDVVVDRNGYSKFSHPQGNPTLTKAMFKYHVEKSIGLGNIQRTLYGRVRSRSKIDAYRGSFTQNVCNISERTERDAYAVKDLPRGLVDGNPLKPLYCVRGRDVASGEILGIGFSQGGERGSAYRMELFCRAISKVKFCELFGIEISEEQWPSIGISSWDVQDRGPGSADEAFARDREFKPVIREMPPSYSGQSKATIESTNPKNRTTDDAPSHFVSDKSVFQLVQREIYRVLKDNESIDISERIPPDLLQHVPRFTPNALFMELDRRGRNDSLQIQFEDAVRTFLTKLKAKVTRRGLMLHGQCFRSDALLSSKLFGRMRGPQEPEVQVYVLDACLRHVWVDVDGELLELDIQAPMRVGNEVMYLSLEEILEREAFILKGKLEHAEHRDAIAAKTETDYQSETGKEWRGGATVQGRVKRGSASAKQEARESKDVVHGKVHA